MKRFTSGELRGLLVLAAVLALVLAVMAWWRWRGGTPERGYELPAELRERVDSLRLCGGDTAACAGRQPAVAGKAKAAGKRGRKKARGEGYADRRSPLDEEI